jgi:hypothetical protein
VAAGQGQAAKARRISNPFERRHRAQCLAEHVPTHLRCLHDQGRKL